MLGGNIGDVDETFRQAEEYLSERGFVIEKQSRTGTSAAVDWLKSLPTTSTPLSIKA